MAGKPVAVEESLQGIVEGVTYDGNHPYLSVGGNRVELSALTNISKPSRTTYISQQGEDMSLSNALYTGASAV
jgi:hypothetical protein